MVRHILSDGREVESMEGFVVPMQGRTLSVYKIVADISKRNLKEKPEEGGKRECGK